MSEESKKMTLAEPESQRQRWVKYGANVLFTSVVVILLAIMLTWLMQSRAIRFDTTTGGTQSLRPQSVNFIGDLKQPIKIVALYPKLKSDSHEQDFYQPVADLLNEYSTKGKNIQTEVLDPDTQKDEFNKLVTDVTNKYGGEVKGYKAILDSLPAANDAIRKFTGDEAGKFDALPFASVQDQQLQEARSEVLLTLIIVQRDVSKLKDDVDSDLDQQIPSYKDAVDDAKETYTSVSQSLQAFSQAMGVFQNTAGFPKEVRDYAPDAGKRADAARKIADDMLDRIAKLPQVKELDEFKTQLNTKSILIMGDSGYKILQFDQIWKVPESSRFSIDQPDVQPKLSFEGEQQITSAIASLTGGPRRFIVFVRSGGPQLATMSEQGQTPPFAAIADRLRDYNFDVQEKDASGQPPSQENPIPEPTDDQMKSAIWVVVRAHGDVAESPLPTMLADHLKNGGTALVMTFPSADNMEMGLEPMGIHASTDSMIVHESLPAPERQTADWVEAVFRGNQAVFELNHYGENEIAKPLEGLDFLQGYSVPILISKIPPAGVTVWPMLPVPFSPHYWATNNPDAAFSEDRQKIVFNPKPDPATGRLTGDVDNTESNPLYAAAAAEGPGGSRLVVVGSYAFATNDLVSAQDEEMWRQHGLPVARLPGNSEFFVNSVLWLAHMDSMLSISPHALQVARIKQMSPASLGFWRLGVLTIALPLAVIAMGLMVYVKRRD